MRSPLLKRHTSFRGNRYALAYKDVLLPPPTRLTYAVMSAMGGKLPLAPPVSAKTAAISANSGHRSRLHACGVPSHPRSLETKTKNTQKAHSAAKQHTAKIEASRHSLWKSIAATERLVGESDATLRRHRQECEDDDA